MDRPFSRVIDRLKEAGLRPTRQRLALAKLLTEAGDCHLTAEQLHSQAQGAGIRVSLATVYSSIQSVGQITGVPIHARPAATDGTGGRAGGSASGRPSLRGRRRNQGEALREAERRVGPRSVRATGA